MSADSAHDIDCANFFDHIQDLLDFQEDKNVFIGGRCDKFPGAWDGGNGCSPDLAAELLVPYEDVVQMEWLSTFVEDSFYGGNSSTLGKQQFSVTKDVAVAEAVGPVSVLESSSSNSNNGGLKVMPLGRVRSKRPRPPTFNPGSAMQLISPAHSFTDTPPASVSDEGGSFNESPRMAAGSNKKRKVNQSFSAAEMSTDPRAGVRKCLHCEITKTPQWRAGPMGPKTLCNACGVRHKSGRLFPEYRPAASPTFAPSLHSNSHKKVLEMRTTSADTPTTLTPEDNSF